MDIYMKQHLRSKGHGGLFLCLLLCLLYINFGKGNEIPNYVEELDTVERMFYPTLASRQREIMESFTSDQYDQTYNAYESDIAVLYVYFGQPTTTEYIR